MIYACSLTFSSSLGIIIKKKKSPYWMYWLKKETQELSMEIKNFRAGEKKSKRILRLFLNKIKAPTKLNGENASLF